MQRRDFLRSCSSLVAGSGVVFGEAFGIYPDSPPSREREPSRALVVIELAGGCDALNSFIPYSSGLYYRMRPNLAIPRSQVIDLGGSAGLHPAMREVKDLFDRGKVSIIWGAAYPNPSSSHFLSRQVWRTARLEPAARCGWLATVNSPGPNNNATEAVNVGISRSMIRCSPLGEAPITTLGCESSRRSFASNMRTVAALLARSKNRLFYTCLSGFDTHNRQVEPGRPTEGRHAQLLSAFSQGMSAFYEELDHRDVKRPVLLLVYSEFGRSLAENSSLGTEHGTSGIIFILGDRVIPGVFGTRPHLIDERTGEIPYTVDFRSVYATILAHWLDSDPVEVLGRDFPRLGFL